MRRRLALALCVFAFSVFGRAAEPLYRIEIKGKPSVLSTDRPVEKGTVLVFHRHPDGALTGVPREEVVKIEKIEKLEKPSAAVAVPSSAPAAQAAPAPRRPVAAPAAPPGFAVYIPPDQKAATISLNDAVKTTLDSDPRVRQARQAVIQRRGLYQEASGLFDPALLFSPSFDRAVGFLLRGALRPEVQRREALLTLANVLEQVAKDIQHELDVGAVSGNRFGPCSGTTFTINNVSICLDTTAASGLGSQSIDALSRTQFEAILNALAKNQPLPQSRADLTATQKAYNDFYRDLLQRFEAGALEVVARSRESLAKLGVLPREDIRDTLTLDLRADLPLRNGFIIEPIFFLQGLRNNFKDKPAETGFGGRGIPTTYTSVLGIALDTPLLRNFGTTATTAAERAAKWNYEAALEDYAQIAASSTRDTVVAYWNLAAAQESLALQARSAAAQAKTVELSQALVEADEIPRSELDLANARRLDAEAAVAQARQALAAGRVALALAMGLTITDFDQTPLTADPLPESASLEPLAEAPVSILTQNAVRSRGDIKAARGRESAAEILAEAARLNLKPSLGLTFQVDMRSLYESTTTDLKGNVSDISRDVFYGPGYWNAIRGSYFGPSFQLNLKLTLPVQNNVQKGLLVQSEASLSSSSIATRDLERVVQSRTVEVANSVRQSAREVERRRASSGYYEETIRNSFDQYRAGEISLLDAILTERDLTSALLQLVAARQTFATNATQLRFETGALLPYTRTKGDVTFGAVQATGFDFDRSR